MAEGYGFGAEAASVQDLFLSGRKDDALAAVPEELVTRTSLIGSESHIRERVAALRASGVTTINVSSLAKTTGERIEQLEALRAILR